MISKIDIQELIESSATTYKNIVVAYHRAFHLQNVAQALEQKGLTVGYHVDGSKTTINVEKQQIHLVTYNLLCALMHSDQQNISYNLIILEDFSQPSIWKELLLLKTASSVSKIVYHISPYQNFISQPWIAHKNYKINLPETTLDIKDVWSKEGDRITDIIEKACEDGIVWFVTDKRASSSKYATVIDNLANVNVCNLDSQEEVNNCNVLIGTIYNTRKIKNIDAIVAMGYTQQRLFNTETLCQESSIRPMYKEQVMYLKTFLQPGTTMYYTYQKKEYEALSFGYCPLEHNDTSKELFQCIRFWGTETPSLLAKILHPPQSLTLPMLLQKFEFLKLTNSTGDLTEFGKKCSYLNLEPEYAIMAIESVVLNCSENICTLISMFSLDNTLRKFGMNTQDNSHMDIIKAYINQTNMNEKTIRNINSIKNRILRKLGISTSSVSQPFDKKNIMSCIQKGLAFNKFEIEGDHLILPNLKKSIDLTKTSIGAISNVKQSGYYNSIFKTGTFYNFNVIIFL